jgi:hypothetical protein
MNEILVTPFMYPDLVHGNELFWLHHYVLFVSATWRAQCYVRSSDGGIQRVTEATRQVWTKMEDWRCLTAHTLWKINNKSMIIKIYKNYHAFPHSYRAMYRYNWHFSLTYQQLCELRIKSCWNALKLVGWNTWQSFYSPSQTRWTTWNYLWGCTNCFFLSNSQWVIQYWRQLVCCKENNNVLSEDLLTVCSIHGDRSQHWIKSTFRQVHKIAESDY